MSRGFGAVLFGGLIVAGYAAWKRHQDDEAPEFYVVPAQSSGGDGGDDGGSSFGDRLKSNLLGWGVNSLMGALGGQGRAPNPGDQLLGRVGEVPGYNGGWNGGGSSWGGFDLGNLFGGGGSDSTPGYAGGDTLDRAPVTAGQIGPGGVNFSEYEQRHGLPSGYLYRTAQIESALDPSAKNPRSSAGGLFQFINSTAAEYGLVDRYDPVEATDAASRLAANNASYLRSRLGREPTAAELYLAHQQGAGGAWKLLRDKNAPATSVVGSAAVKLNGGNSNMTAGQFADLWLSKF